MDTHQTEACQFAEAHFDNLKDGSKQYEQNLKKLTKVQLGRATSRLKTQISSIQRDAQMAWDDTFDDQWGQIQSDIDSLQSHITDLTKKGIDDFEAEISERVQQGTQGNYRAPNVIHQEVRGPSKTHGGMSIVE